MNFTGFLGNESVKCALRVREAQDDFAHVYLLAGEDGIGKKTLASLLTASLLCRAGSSRPCLTCPACKKVMGAIHPDVFTVSLPEGKKEIPVDSIREMRKFVYIKPNESSRKVIVIRDAETMNRFGQNAILKVLEEGPAYAYFLILTNNAGALLPTIRSRAETLTLSPLSEEEVQKALLQSFPSEPPEKRERAAALSRGILGRAYRALSPEDAPIIDSAETFAHLLLGGEKTETAEFCVKAEREKWDKPVFLDFLDFTAEFLHRELRKRQSETSLSEDRIVVLLQTVQKAETDLRRNTLAGNIWGLLMTAGTP